jgi:dihydrofolate reductase
MTLTLVVAAATNGVIGRDGGLPWPPTGDQRYFKALTMGHPMVMGRRTYESIGRPLPGRTTLVVTRDPGWTADGVVVCHSVDDALAAAASLDEEVFVVGGAQVYAATLSRADRLVVTWVDQEPEGDTMLPPVDWSQWRETGRETHDGFAIVTYRRG